MKSQRKSPRRYNHSNGNSRKDPRPNRGHFESSYNTPHHDDLDTANTALLSTVDTVETYLAEQMRMLIHARQTQEQALRDIRALGEQLALTNVPSSLNEQYTRALATWQSSRRDGVNARQRLLMAMTDRSIPERR